MCRDAACAAFEQMTVRAARPGEMLTAVSVTAQAHATLEIRRVPVPGVAAFAVLMLGFHMQAWQPAALVTSDARRRCGDTGRGVRAMAGQAAAGDFAVS